MKNNYSTDHSEYGREKNMNSRPSKSNSESIKAAISKRSLISHGNSGCSLLVPTSCNHHDVNEEQNGPLQHAYDSIDFEGYEYLDHTADIQFHSWAVDLSSCLSQLVMCMFGYLTNAKSLEIDEEMSANVASNIVAQGHDWHSLVYSFLDEWLFVFHSTGFLVKELDIVSIDRNS